MLSRLALRTLAVLALRGKTWAGDEVYDSSLAAIDQIEPGEKRPFISVYVDDATYDPQASDIMTAPCAASLVLEIGVTARMRDENGETLWGVPLTDAGMEASLDVIERQAMRTLSQDPAPWSEMYRRFVSRTKKRSSTRGASSEKGIRFAGRQVILDVELFRDPAFGGPPGPLWTDLIAAFESDPDLASTAEIFRAAIAEDAGLHDWQRVRGYLGLTLDQARALQIAPPEPAEGTSPPLLHVTAPGAEPEPPTYGLP